MKALFYERNMIIRIILRTINPILIPFAVCFTILGVVSFIFISTNDVYFNYSFIIDEDVVTQFEIFSKGFIGTLFTASATLLIVATFYAQFIEKQKSRIESIFMKMIDYHKDNVNSISISDYHFKLTNKKRVYKIIKGKRAFVIFKLQLFDCLDVVNKLNKENEYNLSDDKILDIAYLSFYYGIDEKWIDFVSKYLKAYASTNIAKQLLEEKQKTLKKDNKNIGRTNQTTLGSYYRNMYNAIKMVDRSIYLSSKEKYSLITIYRSQLSNSELAVLFFNLESRFGIKWKKIEGIIPFFKKRIWFEHNMVERYKLLKNVPDAYLHDYDRKQSFNMDYEDDELVRATT